MLTRLQRHLRQRFMDRRENLRRQRRLGFWMRQAQNAKVGEMQAYKELEARKNCTVWLGVERDHHAYGPLLALRLTIQPEYFRLSFYRRSGDGFSNVSAYAAMIADEVRHKVARALVDAITKERT